ncbi:MAG: SPOR domain-containing protein [Pseudomonadota bacterium]
MKRKGKESKLNIVLTALLVVFVCLLSFSIGVISGKGWSDREYKVRHIEQDSHLKQAMDDSTPIGDEMTEKEVELLTQRALEEAKAEAPKPLVAKKEKKPKPMADLMAENDKKKEPASASDKKEEAKPEKPMGREASTAMKAKADPKAMMKKEMAKAMDKKKPRGKRQISSLQPQPTVAKPATVNYTVQVAAYKTIDEAEVHSQKLIDKGFPAFPVKAFIKGQPWYRVGIGSFKNRRQAMKYEKALKKQAVVKSTFIQEIKRLEK